jgi:pyridoxamine 5'-phosphate oxidase
MPDPLQTFKDEMARAEAAGVELANAVTLATVDAQGLPRARVVLVKGIDEQGVEFFTNYQSDKAADLESRPHASIAVYWHRTLKQIRLTGPVEKLTDLENDAYFATRPRGSQVGAWASDQSRPLESMAALEARVAEVEKRFEGRDVPRPTHWGGYRLLADDVEIWTDGKYRLHERLRYRRQGDAWHGQLLNP